MKNIKNILLEIIINEIKSIRIYKKKLKNGSRKINPGTDRRTIR